MTRPSKILVVGSNSFSGASFAAYALEQGAEGCTFSGAGPAIFAVVDRALAGAVAQAMAQAWRGAGIPSQVRICRLEGQGARILEGG